MNRIFHGEAEFSYLVANWAEVTVVSVLSEPQRGVIGKGICTLVMSRVLVFLLSKNRLKSYVSDFLGPNVEFI